MLCVLEDTCFACLIFCFTKLQKFSESLKSLVRPLVLVLTDRGNVMTVRFEGEATENVIKTSEEAWGKIVGSEPFEYSFLDDDFDKLFRAEQRLGRVFTTFTVLAIFIACLGLFGLAAYSAAQQGDRCAENNGRFYLEYF